MSQIYSKSSFDRFGDDLCELILSYLSFDDKIRAQCVSTQFSRSVYQKQYELTLNEKVFTRLKKSDILGNERTDIKSYKLFIKKMTSLTKLSIKYNTLWCRISKLLQMIELTIKYCKYLKDIEIDFIHIRDYEADRVFKKFGPYITKVKFSRGDYFGESYCITNLSNCTSLKVLKTMDIHHLFHGKNNCLINCLKEITFCLTNWDVETFENFLSLNMYSLETVVVFIHHFIHPNHLEIFLFQLTKIRGLRKLKIKFTDIYDFSIIENLVQISEKCEKLEEFYIIFYSQTIDSNIDLFDSMKNFKNLKKLTIKLYTEDIPERPFQYYSNIFSECPRLTHLTFRANANSIKDEFFDNIGKYIPKLRYLNVWNTDITDEALTSIKELKYLKKLKLATSKPTKISEDSVNSLKLICHNINLKNFETLDLDEFKSYTELMLQEPN